MTHNRPSPADIETAAGRLRGRAVETPLLESPLLSRRLGGRLLLKPECLQLTGSFKFRGAYNKLASLDDRERGRGVVAHSSGNHAQGVAAAASMFGVPAVIVMPGDAPSIKIEGTRAWGAEIVACDRRLDSREAIVAEVACRRGLVTVPPYDDADIIAGQGTAGLEIVRACTARDVAPDAAVIGCGGGGLSSGIAIALRHAFPAIELHTAEPAGWDDTARSLAAGRRLGVDGTASSLCDALLAPIPGELTFEINRRLMTSGVAVTDDEAIEAMAAAAEFFKLIVEPGGAVALAAVLHGRIAIRGRCVVVIVSGGNIEPERHGELVTARRAAAARGRGRAGDHAQ